MIFKDYPSKTNPGQPPYRAQVDPGTSLISCKCRGWTNKKEGMVRHCTHTDDLIVVFRLTIEERDGQQFMVSVGDPKPVEKIAKAVARLDDPQHFIQPMKASSMPDRMTAADFEANLWVMEEKYDGHRIILAVNHHGGTMYVSAWSGGEKARTLPDHILAIARKLPPGIYDGELTVPGKHSYDVTAGMNAGTEVLVLFDLLQTAGQDATHLTYDERRMLLAEALKGIPAKGQPVQLIEQLKPSMAGVEKIWKRGGEGVILKHRESRYQPGYRTDTWVKIKKEAAATLVIIGYEAGKVGPYSAVKIRDPKGIETTVKTLDNATMRQMQKNPDSFIGRSLVISYQERTPKGKYRHPMWDHLLEARP